MVVIDEALLKSLSGPGPCELCGRACLRREAHHCFTRGHGGGNRLDALENLVSVGRTEDFACQCHRLFHDGKIPRRCVLSVIALREGRTADQLERFVYAVRLAPKGSDLDMIRREVFREVAA